MKHSMFILVAALLVNFGVLTPVRADFVPADAAEPRYEIALTASQDLSDWLAAQNSPWHAEIFSMPDGRQSLRIAYTDGFTIIVR